MFSHSEHIYSLINRDIHITSCNHSEYCNQMMIEF